MDLTKPGNYPRSGRITLGGVVYLPRAIDKMRADVAGTVGEYIAMCPQSRRVYDFVGFTGEQLRKVVQDDSTDEGVLRALQEKASRRPGPEEVARFNEAMLSAGPDEEMAPHFHETLEAMGRADRTDVKTFVDFQDLEEEREVPRRS